MEKFKYLVLLILAGFIISSCATTQNVANEARTEVYNSEYDNTFKAVVQTLSNEGYAINTADSETGIINTDYSNISTLAALFVGDRRTKINGIISEVDSGTQVRLTVSVQKKGTFTGWQSATMTKSQAKEYYQDLFGKIGNRIATEK